MKNKIVKIKIFDKTTDKLLVETPATRNACKEIIRQLDFTKYDVCCVAMK